MKNIILFLKELNLIRDDYERRAEREEHYNIFSVLFKSSDEVKLHSRFISSLLNPYGSHKLSDYCLRSFLNICGYPPQFIQNLLAPGVAVHPNEFNFSEWDEIDILIINERTSYALFIENKIYARDSNHEEHGQLEGYYRTILEKYHIPERNLEAIFLSMGRKPSEDSMGSRYPRLKKILQIIHYDDAILRWLNNCLKVAVEKPFLRETILQYIKLVRNMTNNISIDERKDIKNLIGRSSENMAAAKLLVENFVHVKWHTVVDFWDELTRKLQSIGYDVSQLVNLSAITFITHNEEYKQGYRGVEFGICFVPVEGLHMYVWYAYGKSLYYGICDDAKLSVEYKDKIKRLFCLGGYLAPKDDKNWVYKYFDLPEEEKIYFNDFAYTGTFKLINDEYRHNIIEKMATEIQGFVEQLDNI